MKTSAPWKTHRWQAELTQVVSPEAYLLFYVKKDLKSFHRQSVSLPDNWPFVIEGRKRVTSLSGQNKTREQKNNIFVKGGDPVKRSEIKEHIKRSSMFQTLQNSSPHHSTFPKRPTNPVASHGDTK